MLQVYGRSVLGHPPTKIAEASNAVLSSALASYVEAFITTLPSASSPGNTLRKTTFMADLKRYLRGIGLEFTDAEVNKAFTICITVGIRSGLRDCCKCVKTGRWLAKA